MEITFSSSETFTKFTDIVEAKCQFCNKTNVLVYRKKSVSPKFNTTFLEESRQFMVEHEECNEIG